MLIGGAGRHRTDRENFMLADDRSNIVFDTYSLGQIVGKGGQLEKKLGGKGTFFLHHDDSAFGPAGEVRWTNFIKEAAG